MLVVSRKVGQGIELTWPDGRTVKVSLVMVKGSNTARIGIEAQQDCKILRSELPKGDRPAA